MNTDKKIAKTITVKRAKELCLIFEGRLPRMGYEMKVCENEDGSIRTYLQNISGTYKVRVYESVR